METDKSGQLSWPIGKLPARSGIIWQGSRSAQMESPRSSPRAHLLPPRAATHRLRDCLAHVAGPVGPTNDMTLDTCRPLFAARFPPAGSGQCGPVDHVIIISRGSIICSAVAALVAAPKYGTPTKEHD